MVAVELLSNLPQVLNDIGSDLSTGFADRLSNLPSWVWMFIAIAIVFLMKPWENIKGIPTWIWWIVGVLAVWVMITGR